MGEIREDQKAKLYFKTENNSEQELDCLIKSIQKDRLSLKFPKEMLEYAKYLEEGNEVPVKIFTPSGVRMFTSMILNSPLESEFVIEYVEDNIKVQRREYLRINIETKVVIKRLNSESITVNTLDIGGGGIRFFYEGELSPGEVVDCNLYLPFQMSSIKARGNILDKPHLNKNEHVVIFSKILESDRDKIIKKCFEVQAQHHKAI